MRLRGQGHESERVSIRGHGPGRGGYIDIPVLKNTEFALEDVAVLNTKLKDFVRVSKSTVPDYRSCS
jgi:hypothetical protein